MDKRNVQCQCRKKRDLYAAKGKIIRCPSVHFQWRKNDPVPYSARTLVGPYMPLNSKIASGVFIAEVQ